MKSQDGAGEMTAFGGHSRFGELPALTGLPTAISCQCFSKMVERAAFRCTGKRGSLLRMEWRREEAMQRRARRKGGQNQQQPLLLLLFCFSVLFFCASCQLLV